MRCHFKETNTILRVTVPVSMIEAGMRLKRFGEGRECQGRAFLSW